MAEGFANFYGSDVLVAESFGLAPVPRVPREGIVAMREKNIDISKHISRRYDPINGAMADIVVNMSDYRLPGARPKMLIEWQIADPYGQPITAYRKTRDVLENQVMMLILSLRKR
jgi:arsenate reductase (thioredoxin)